MHQHWCLFRCGCSSTRGQPQHNKCRGPGAVQFSKVTTAQKGCDRLRAQPPRLSGRFIKHTVYAHKDSAMLQNTLAVGKNGILQHTGTELWCSPPERADQTQALKHEAITTIRTILAIHSQVRNHPQSLREEGLWEEGAGVPVAEVCSTHIWNSPQHCKLCCTHLRTRWRDAVPGSRRNAVAAT